MATALDVVGDRWTMLILRELLGGPARFNELEAGLAGIAKNLLTDRLRRLEGDGILKRTASHGTTLYALTPQGEAIRPTLEHLAFWGAKLERIAPAEHERSIRAIAMALHAVVARSSALPASAQTIELEVDEDEYLEIVLGPRPSVTARPSPEADARISVSTTTLTDFLAGRSFPSANFAHVAGDPNAKTSLLRTLSLPTR